MKTRRILIIVFTIVLSLGNFGCRGDQVTLTQSPEMKPTGKSTATETQTEQSYPYPYIEPTKKVAYPYPAPTLTVVKATPERSNITPDPTSTRTPPIPTLQPTPIPIQELSISRQVFPLSSETLPADAIWILLGDRVVALTPERETFYLQVEQVDDDIWLPWTIGASSDGTKISYSLRDLVVDNFSTSERWIYSYDEYRAYFTHPQYSPDGTGITFTAVETGWAIKRIDLISGSVNDIPIPEDFWQTTSELQESTSVPHLASIVQPGGIRKYAFFPVVWTELGIYGIMVLPGTDAGHSGFWLADPENGDIAEVIDTGWTMAPRHGGESVAVLDAFTFPPVEPFTSTITLWNIQGGSQEILYQDFQHQVWLGSWSPQEDRIYLSLRREGDGYDTPLIRIISEAGNIENEFDFSYLLEGEKLVDIDWLDNDTLIFMISDSDKRIAEVYTLPVFSESVEARRLIANIPVENMDGWHGILHIPSP